MTSINQQYPNNELANRQSIGRHLLAIMRLASGRAWCLFVNQAAYMTGMRVCVCFRVCFFFFFFFLFNCFLSLCSPCHTHTCTYTTSYHQFALHIFCAKCRVLSLDHVYFIWNINIENCINVYVF